jgi:hypothetical protein
VAETTRPEAVNDYVPYIIVAICTVVVLGIAIRWAIRQRKLGD